MGDYTVVIIIALIGFLIVAFLLLAPVYRFLDREEKRSRHWTDENLRKSGKFVPPNGHSENQPG